MSRTEREQALYDIAQEQHGLFTTKQAIKVGYQPKSHLHHVKNKNWIRLWRGIYRLARYPHSVESEYVKWYLWSCDRTGRPQGILSHETVLSLYELSDVNPSRIHMTVPKTFRKSANIPKILLLHMRNLGENEVTKYRGLQLTTPIRTIKDIILDHTTSWEFIAQAIEEGVQRGIIRRRQLKELEHFGTELDPQEQKMLAQALERVKA